MAQRGRKSAANLASLSLVPAARPPAPPRELTREQAELWREVVNARPSQFITCLPLVDSYAVHVSIARELMRQVKSTPASDIKRYDKLTRMLARETASITRLASRLRLLPSKAAEPYRGPRPWES